MVDLNHVEGIEDHSINGHILLSTLEKILN